MRWGVEKRLEFIEFRLFWEGGINRADLIDTFGVSVPQASKDLALYDKQAPGNLHYDRSEKRYFAAADFRPTFLKPDAEPYLAQLSSIAKHKGTAGDIWLSDKLDSDAVPVPYRRVDVNVLRSILGAIREKKALEILYQSMSASRPGAEWRWITPHAFGNDGLRWHVRAYCRIDKKFKDFLLPRCLDARAQDQAGATAADDTIWNESFDVVLSPNPALSENQQAVVAQDYNMTDGRICVPVRKALLYYFQKRLRLDTASTIDGPHEAPVVIANREAFARALAEATA